MSGPRIQVIGVHCVECTDALLAEAVEDKYDQKPGQWGYRRAAKAARKEIESAVLIELIVTDCEDMLQEFDDGRFRQHKGHEESGNDQVAWWTSYLMTNGAAVLSLWKPKSDGNAYRIAFFLHYYDPNKPLQSRWGSIDLPAPTTMPPRLAALCPYENTD